VGRDLDISALTFSGILQGEGQGWFDHAERLDQVGDARSDRPPYEGWGSTAHVVALATPIAFAVFIDGVSYTRSPLAAQQLAGPEALAISIPRLTTKSHIRLHVKNSSSSPQAVCVQLRKQPPHWR